MSTFFGNASERIQSHIKVDSYETLPNAHSAINESQYMQVGEKNIIQYKMDVDSIISIAFWLIRSREIFSDLAVSPIQ